jgi:glycosyltransferase involved in cell wall biosynthesis
MYTVLHTESSKGWGGQENRIYHEALGIKKLGARVIIVCQPGSVIGQRAAAAIEVEYCNMRKSYDIPAIHHLLNVIKKEQVDVVNTHSGKDSLLAAIAGRLSSRKPVIVRTRHLALPITSRFTYSILPHRVVTVSERVRQYLVNEEGIRPGRVAAVPTGVNLEMFDPDKNAGMLRAELNLADNVPLVGMVAIFRIKKGHHILLEAVPHILKEIPDTVFVLAGNGPTLDKIKSMVKEMDLEKHILFPGLRPDVPDILKSIDIFVLPTLQEALGTSILEAMAMEKPVVSSRVDGVPEIVKEGITGLLVEPDNPETLAKAIITLLRDKNRARKMGVEGRKLAEQYFTVDKMVNGMHDLYTSLLKSRENIK